MCRQCRNIIFRENYFVFSKERNFEKTNTNFRFFLKIDKKKIPKNHDTEILRNFEGKLKKFSDIQPRIRMVWIPYMYIDKCLLNWAHIGRLLQVEVRMCYPVLINGCLTAAFIGGLLQVEVNNKLPCIDKYLLNCAHIGRLVQVGVSMCYPILINVC